MNDQVNQTVVQPVEGQSKTSEVQAEQKQAEQTKEVHAS